MNELSNIEYKFYEKLDSTNLEARRLAILGKPSWILSKFQTHGRGRQNKEWISDVNNFTASLLYYPKDSFAQFPFRSYVAGLALFDTISFFGIRDRDLILKWPNDLLINNKKVGGILLETVSEEKKNQPALIVGFGVNLFSYPKKELLKDTEFRATSLAENLKKVPDVKTFLKVLNTNYGAWEGFLLTKGFKVLRSHFLKKTVVVGQELIVKLPRKIIEGSFLGISDEGSLLLQSGDNVVTITAGDVHMVGG